MTIKTIFALTAFSILTLSTSTNAQKPPPTAPTATEQSAVLQGTWEGIELGREAAGKCTMTVTGNTIHFEGSTKEEWYKATFTLPAETNPKQLAAKITDCPQPDFVGKSSFAIFKVEDGKLTLTGSKPGSPEAPKSFDGDETSRTFVFKKIQAK